MIDYTNLEKSLAHLDAQFANHLAVGARPELTALDRDAVAESVVQRFETCYDVLRKVLRRFLNEELGITPLPNSPKPILRLAGQNGLLAGTVEQWLEYADARTSTAHDYSETKARAVLELVPRFVTGARTLLARMKEAGKC